MEPSVNNRSCFTRINATMAAYIPGPVKTIYGATVTPACEKLGQFSKKYIFPTVTNSLKAKVLPLSNPPGWEEKKDLTQKNIARLEGLIKYTNKTKPQLIRKISPQKSSPKHNSSFEKNERVFEVKEKLAHEFEKKLEKAKAYDSYLNILWISEIFSRCAGYAGWIATEFISSDNSFISLGLAMGTEFIPKEFTHVVPDPLKFTVTQCIQVTAIAMHIKGAFNLQGEDKNKNIAEARKRILCAAASTAYMIAVHNLRQNACLDSSTLPHWLCNMPAANSKTA